MMKKGYKSLNNFFSKNEFLGSYYEFTKIPKFNKPEICFIGRSNVGKSSLINKITKEKNLAKTSKTPGRTQSLNLYLINNKIILADLPGYGFAKISENLKKQLYKLIKEYVEKRTNLNHIFLLIDAKIGIKKNDLETLFYLKDLKVPSTIILTKIDRCSKKIMEDNYKKISLILSSISPKFQTIYSTSSQKNDGIANIQKNIYSIILK